MTMIPDLYNDATLIHRWELIDGRPRCLLDGLPVDDALAIAALQQNAAIRSMMSSADSYEAATALVARGEPDNGAPRQIPDPAAVRPEDAPEDWAAPLIDNPAWSLLPRTVETIGPSGEDGQETTAPEPRWQAFDAASAIVAAASPTTLALALWRQGEPSQDDADAHAAWAQAKADTLAALASEAAKPLAHDPRPVPDEISDRQFWQSCAMLGLCSTDEALAAVTVGTLPASLMATIGRLPAPQQFGAKIIVAGSNSFHLSNPMTGTLMALMGKTQADAQAIWRLGATL